jgi:diaminopimelate epimerase
MEFYNPDGSGGMMCGNGGRCIVAFANYLGINPADGHIYHFLAPDGEHTAEILSQEIPGEKWTVRLRMIDVQGITPIKDGLFLNTGTRHYVQFVDRVDSMDMETEAKPIRWDVAFQPEGTNVNLVEVRADGLHVRTFEKGVEGETLACGTGLTACALAAYKARIPSQTGNAFPAGNTRLAQPRPGISYRLQCRRGDWLQVDFQPGPNDTFTNIYLTGPAELLAVNPL